MKNTMILTPEQEQTRKEREQALESLKYNSMCYSCEKFCAGCNGTAEKLWSGCVWYKKADFPNIYILVKCVPELIKNEDFSSYDDFLEELRSNRNSVIDWLESRLRGEHFKNEILTNDYLKACKKILEILKEA